MGTLSRTRVVIAYMEGVTNIQHVNTVRQRLSDLDYDVLFETSLLEQLITDNSNSPFPLFLSSERLDRIMYSLFNGEVAIFAYIPLLFIISRVSLKFKSNVVK